MSFKDFLKNIKNYLIQKLRGIIKSLKFGEKKTVSLKGLMPINEDIPIGKQAQIGYFSELLVARALYEKLMDSGYEVSFDRNQRQDWPEKACFCCSFL